MDDQPKMKKKAATAEDAAAAIPKRKPFVRKVAATAKPKPTASSPIASKRLAAAAADQSDHSMKKIAKRVEAQPISKPRPQAQEAPKVSEVRTKKLEKAKLRSSLRRVSEPRPSVEKKVFGEERRKKSRVAAGIARFEKKDVAQAQEEKQKQRFKAKTRVGKGSGLGESKGEQSGVKLRRMHKMNVTKRKKRLRGSKTKKGGRSLRGNAQRRVSLPARVLKDKMKLKPYGKVKKSRRKPIAGATSTTTTTTKNPVKKRKRRVAGGKRMGMQMKKVQSQPVVAKRSVPRKKRTIKRRTTTTALVKKRKPVRRSVSGRVAVAAVEKKSRPAAIKRKRKRKVASAMSTKEIERELKLPIGAAAAKRKKKISRRVPASARTRKVGKSGPRRTTGGTGRRVPQSARNRRVTAAGVSKPKVKTGRVKTSRVVSKGKSFPRKATRSRGVTKRIRKSTKTMRDVNIPSVGKNRKRITGRKKTTSRRRLKMKKKNVDSTPVEDGEAKTVKSK